MSASGIAIARRKALAAQVSAPPLRVSFSWTVAGNVVYAACQFGMLSVLAKLGSPSIVGQYALGLAITAPVFMMTNLQLRGVQATDAHHEFGFADYFTLRLISTLLGTLVILLLTLFAVYDTSTKMVIVLVAGAKAIETISDVIAGHLQKSERLDQVARALMIRGDSFGGHLRGSFLGYPQPDYYGRGAGAGVDGGHRIVRLSGGRAAARPAYNGSFVFP